MLRYVFLFGAVLGLAGPAHAITLNQIDDFQSGSVAGWDEGAVSPNPPTNQSTGGPGGAGDRYLRNTSNGSFGPGGRMVMFNLAQWRGNYTAAGVTKVRMHLANFGNAPLTLRVAVEGPNGMRFASTNGHVVTNNGQWVQVDFNLNDMTKLSFNGTIEEALADVNVFRILAAVEPAWQGDVVVATIGVDNIQALNELSPVEGSTWGGIKALYAD